MMLPTHLVSGVHSSLQPMQPIQHALNTFWRADQVHGHLRNLQETIHLLKSVQEELEGIYLIERSNYIVEGDGMASIHLKGQNLHTSPYDSSGNEMLSDIAEIMKEKKVCPEVQESLALEAANSLVAILKSQLTPFNAITSQLSQWEEKSMAVKLAQKQQKYKRNKHWKKRKRKQVAELIRKVYEGYDKADEDADEWRAREIAKDIAKRKMESMKSIAKLKTIEERKRLESELELVLVVEKLQELRSIRVQKLKKQGHFFPEEDDKFLERVRSAVEEEERQAAAASDTHAARDAISTAEESRKAIQITNPDANIFKQNKVGSPVKQEQVSAAEIERSTTMDATHGSEQKTEGQGFNNAYESVTNLPFEFYHYYHGSNNDMGTLIEIPASIEETLEVVGGDNLLAFLQLYNGLIGCDCGRSGWWKHWRWQEAISMIACCFGSLDFMNVRRVWDAYIRPGGSRIPGHWVQPPLPADEVWASYLVGT